MKHVYSQQEIESIREGGKKLSQIMKDLGNFLYVGMTVHEIEMKARELIIAVGASSATIGYKTEGAKTAFPSAACVSVNEEVAHGIAFESKKIIRSGDVVSIDIVIKYQGVFVDICRTYGVGALSPDSQRLIATARAVTDAAIAMAVAGNTVNDIGIAAESTAKENNCSTIKELGGHGVGKKIHMAPFVPNFAHSGYKDPVVAGMVLAIEPIVSLGDWRIDLGSDGWVFTTRDQARTAQFEETVIVTEDGQEIVTADN